MSSHPNAIFSFAKRDDWFRSVVFQTFSGFPSVSRLPLWGKERMNQGGVWPATNFTSATLSPSTRADLLLPAIKV